MKHLISLLAAFIFWMLTYSTSTAALPVVDVGLIATSLHNAKKDLLEQLLQGDTQEDQLKQLHTQINQVDDFLARLGRLEDVKDLPGFNKDAEAFLKELERNLPSFEIIRDLDPEELFRAKSGSPYKPVDKNIIIGGEKAGEINGVAVKPELAARRAADHYERVRSEVLTKRSALKDELDASVRLIRDATTAAEVQKLTAIISAIQTQLAATDSDLRFASDELSARYFQNKIEEDIQQKVGVQTDRTALTTGMRKYLDLFKLPSKPALFKTRN